MTTGRIETEFRKRDRERGVSVENRIDWSTVVTLAILGVAIGVIVGMFFAG